MMRSGPFQSPFVVSLSNHRRAFDKLRPNGAVQLHPNNRKALMIRAFLSPRLWLLLAGVALLALAALLPLLVAPAAAQEPDTVSTFEPDVEFTVKQGVYSDGSGGQLILSNSMTISEGLTANYFVRLWTKPTANVTVAPASSSSAVEVNTGHDGPLTFTPQNWANFQGMQVFTSPGAADDDNAGSIVHTVTSDDSDYDGLTPAFTLNIVGTSSACTASAAPTLTVDDSNRFMSVSPFDASCGSTPIVGYDTAVRKDGGPWEFRANTRWAYPSAATYSVGPAVNWHPVFSASTYEVKTRGLTYKKGVSPWSPVSTITVGGVKSSDANLLGLRISPGDLEFDADTTEYTVNVAQSTTSVTVNALARDWRATVTVDGSPLGPAGNRISLVEGEDKAIPVVATAEDGVTTKTYTITVTRGEGSGNQGPGGL